MVGLVALGGVVEEEDNELGVDDVRVVPLGNDAEGEHECVALLDGDHLLGRLQEHKEGPVHGGLEAEAGADVLEVTAVAPEHRL